MFDLDKYPEDQDIFCKKIRAFGGISSFSLRQPRRGNSVRPAQRRNPPKPLG
jgi:hypothetical protein